MEVPEQPTDEILLVDPENQGYEDLPDDITDEGNKEEFEESDGPSDDPSDGYDDEWISLCHIY